MKKQKLQVDFAFDFDVYGVVSGYKDYKLAWNINRSLNIRLQKEQDVSLKFFDSELVLSYYKYKTESSELRLLRNKSYEKSGGENQYLIPEVPQIDYFVMVEGEINGYSVNEMHYKLRKTKGVEFVMKLDVANLKSRENFIF